MNKSIMLLWEGFIVLLTMCCYWHVKKFDQRYAQKMQWQKEKYDIISNLVLRPHENKSVNFHFENIPSIWPTKGNISSLFGMWYHPILKRMKFHSGVDIANLQSTDIIATADGTVEFAGKKGGYGNAIIIDHGNGYKTLYSHAQTLLVKVGDHVKRGTLIATMGSTGLSTGAHLHYEISFAGESLDPTWYVN